MNDNTIPSFSPGTLQLLRSILGDNFAQSDAYKRAVEEYASESARILAGTSPAPLEGGAHGPCC